MSWIAIQSLITTSTVINCIAFVDEPMDIDYFKFSFKNSRAIDKIKILEVSGSLGIVSSVHAEAGCSSDLYAVPTDVLRIAGIKKQILCLLKEDKWN